jgi:hypothetical protein
MSVWIGLQPLVAPDPDKLQTDTLELHSRFACSSSQV